MSFDMSQFHAVFFEESQEHLDSMESLLLAVDVAAPDSEALNAIFRAAHSIKGSSATFGFTDVAALTHIMEALLDRVRTGQMPLTEDIVDATLAAADVLRNLLAAHQGQETADQAAAQTLRERMLSLADGLSESAGASHADAHRAELRERARRYELRFTAATSTEQGLQNLLSELRELGEVLDTRMPEQPDGEWYVVLATDVDSEMLASILGFIADEQSIRVRELEGGDGKKAAPPDGHYGFFHEAPGGPDVPTTLPDEAWGLFEPTADLAAPPVASGDEGFGFFDPLPLQGQLGALEDDSASFGVVPPVASRFPQALEHAPSPRTPRPVAAVEPPTASGDPKTPARARSDASSIRVNVERVDQMINLVGELVIAQAMLSQAASQLDPVLFEKLHEGLATLERSTRDLQEAVISIRMLPISTVFSRFPRVVRDLSQKLGKRVELILSGENTELDKSLIERITDPLTHLVRNSLDHGIESPADRSRAGKSEVGRINLRAYHQSGNIVIEVADDGAGLNRQRILDKARERGLPASDSMSDQDVWQLIFEPGFSTAEVVTDVSGRGVGMDVVKRNIAALGGRIELDSMPGVGTRISVRLPLTLAILDGMSVALCGETYIIPLDYVVESLQPAPAMLKAISGVERLLDVRGEYLPILDLHEQFGLPIGAGGYSQGIMVILESDGNKAAVFVDALIGQHQVVIKSLEANYRRVPGISGATIMGDGHVALILDPPRLVADARRASAS